MKGNEFSHTSANEVFTLTELRDWCKLYDETEGEWPESRLEGRSVFGFILENLGLVEWRSDSHELIESWDKI